MSDLEFLKTLMGNIIEGSKIPKVQVEREIGPLLEMFLPEILTHLYSDASNGVYQMILPEFPLKKDNNQSTNIDYLLINEKTKKIVFLELKTDRSSFSESQKETYCKLKNKIERQGAYFLIEDVEFIRDASQKTYKYQYVLDRCDQYRDAFEEIKMVEIIYLVPEGTMTNLETNEIEVLSFNSLPVEIDSRFREEWKVIRNALLKLDEFPEHPQASENIEQTIKNNVESYIKKNNISTMPAFVYLGKTGSKGKSPNYQVEFSDGSIKTFHFSGKRHRIERFDSKNLTQITWNKLAQK